MGEKKNNQSSSAAFKVGAISLAFLILGYQAALFVHRAATLRIEANRDRPDTVYIYLGEAAGGSSASGVCVSSEGTLKRENVPSDVSPGGIGHARNNKDPQYDSGAGTPEERIKVERHYAQHSEAVQKVRKATRPVESFRFNPNTAGMEDLQRLGFSEKQAQSILNYREKGGKFRRKEDFAKSFVVADSVYRRLEPFIDIPLLDINRADSAAFDALPGIGGWFAAKMVRYREEIGGYTSTEQLMDIERFDSERYEGLKDLITCLPLHGGDGGQE